MKKRQVPLPFLIEEGIEGYEGIQDQVRLGIDYFCDDDDYYCYVGGVQILIAKIVYVLIVIIKSTYLLRRDIITAV